LEKESTSASLPPDGPNDFRRTRILPVFIQQFNPAKFLPTLPIARKALTPSADGHLAKILVWSASKIDRHPNKAGPGLGDDPPAGTGIMKLRGLLADCLTYEIMDAIAMPTPVPAFPLGIRHFRFRPGLAAGDY